METEVGSIVWFDIPVSHFDTAKSFYGELFGWKFEAMGDEKTTGYWMIKVGTETIGGLRKLETPIKETDSPILYFAADKLDAATKRAKKMGATLVGDRVDIGDSMGSYQWFRDQDKNLLAIWAEN